MKEKKIRGIIVKCAIIALSMGLTVFLVAIILLASFRIYLPAKYLCLTDKHCAEYQKQWEESVRKAEKFQKFLEDARVSFVKNVALRTAMHSTDDSLNWTQIIADDIYLETCDQRIKMYLCFLEYVWTLDELLRNKIIFIENKEQMYKFLAAKIRFFEEYSENIYEMGAEIMNIIYNSNRYDK